MYFAHRIDPGTALTSGTSGLPLEVGNIKEMKVEGNQKEKGHEEGGQRMEGKSP